MDCGISFSFAAQVMESPACMAPIKQFFLGELCFVIVRYKREKNVQHDQ